MRRSLLTLAALAWLAAAGTADARPGHGPPGAGPPPGAMIDFHADELGLDEATREAIREIVEESHVEGRALQNEARAARHALHALLRVESVDRDAVLELVERVGELETEAEKHRIETMLEIREQLSPEQRAALVEMRGRMRDLHVGPILDACGADAEALCEGDGPRAVHCLLRQRDQLSEGCAAALEELPSRFGKGRGCSHGKGYACPHVEGQPCPYGKDQPCPHATGQSCPHETGQSCPHETGQSCPHETGQPCPHATGQPCPHRDGPVCPHGKPPGPPPPGELGL